MPQAALRSCLPYPSTFEQCSWWPQDSRSSHRAQVWERGCTSISMRATIGVRSIHSLAAESRCANRLADRPWDLISQSAKETAPASAKVLEWSPPQEWWARHPEAERGQK